MFAPFFFQFSLLEPLAQYVLREEQESWLSWLATSSETKTVCFDRNYTSPLLHITEYSPSRLKSSPLHHSFRLTGTGRALGNTQLVQDKSYFEVRLIHRGAVHIGVAKANRDHLEKPIGEDSESWGPCFITIEGNAGFPVNEGDVIGCVLDQSDFPARLTYYVSGKHCEEATITGMRGPLLPAISVCAGAEAEVTFCGGLFRCEPPSGASAIIFSQNYLF